MFDIDSPEAKRQLKYCKQEIKVNDEGEITVYALGGFMPKDEDKAAEFVKTSPLYRWAFGAPTHQPPWKSLYNQENAWRMMLVDKGNRFINALERTNCSVRRARKMVDLSRTYLELLSNRVPEFKRMWEAIYEDVTDKLEEAGLKRAIDGVQEPVYYQGELVGYKTVYSDQVLTFMLQGRRKKYQRASLQASLETEGVSGKTKLIMAFPEDRDL